MGSFPEKKLLFSLQVGKNTWNKIKCLPIHFSPLFLFLKCYISDEELKLQGLLVTEGAVEPDMGQKERAKCPVCPFNNS